MPANLGSGVLERGAQGWLKQVSEARPVLKGVRQRASGASSVTHLQEGRFHAARAGAAAQLPGLGAGRSALGARCSAKLRHAQLRAALGSRCYKKAEKGGRAPRFRKRNGEESTSWKSQVGNPRLLEGPELPVQPLQLSLQMLLLICQGGF